MSKRIADDLTPEQLQHGILNLDAQLAEAHDAIREAADRRAEFARDPSILETLLVLKSQEMAASP